MRNREKSWDIMGINGMTLPGTLQSGAGASHRPDPINSL
jgi:hypothetical protein